MSILKKIRSLPEKKRKIILWVVMSVITISFFSIYVQGIRNTLKENEGKEFFDKSYFQKIQEQVIEAKDTILDNIKNEK